MAEAPAGSPSNPIHLPRSQKVLEAYYGGKRLESPLGGQLDVLGVREGNNATGRVLLECNASSLRYVLIIPKATPEEKARVEKALEAGEDLYCPRHGPGRPLAKSGKSWHCPRCGVVFLKE